MYIQYEYTYKKKLCVLRCRRRARVRGSSSCIYIYKAIRAAGCYFLYRCVGIAESWASHTRPTLASRSFWLCRRMLLRFPMRLQLCACVLYSFASLKNILQHTPFLLFLSYNVVHTYIHYICECEILQVCVYNKLKHSKILSLH